jgi:8-oxo-dGTP diphosphatase
MKVRPSALIIHNQHLLTLKYSYPKGNIYALPGGNLEFGEELASALQRELLEEVTLKVKVGNVRFIAEVFNENVNTIHFVFEMLSYEGVPTLNPAETTAEEIVWLPLENLQDYMLYPNIGEYLNKDIPSLFLGVIDQPRY